MATQKPVKRVAARQPARHKDRRRVLVLVGTRKGAFIFTSDRSRREWKVAGPHFAGWGVQHITHDGRDGGRGTLFAALRAYPKNPFADTVAKWPRR